MSEQFTNLTKQVREYADLENLFRMRALVLAMHFRSLSPCGSVDLDRFLPAYGYQPETAMPPSKPGLANYREWAAAGYILYPMVAGGVGMDMVVNEKSFVKKQDPRFPKHDPLFHFRMQALTARPSKDSLYWPVSPSKLAQFNRPLELHGFLSSTRACGPFSALSRVKPPELPAGSPLFTVVGQ